MPTFLFPTRSSSFTKSSMSIDKPQAAMSRASAAPVEVETMMSASLNACVAALLHSWSERKLGCDIHHNALVLLTKLTLIEFFTAAVAMSWTVRSLSIPFEFLSPLLCLSLVSWAVAWAAFCKAFCASGSLSIAASKVWSHKCFDTADAFPTRTTFSPSFRRPSAKLSAPTLLKAQARTLAFGEMDRHWCVKPNPMALAVDVLPKIYRWLTLASNDLKSNPKQHWNLPVPGGPWIRVSFRVKAAPMAASWGPFIVLKILCGFFWMYASAWLASFTEFGMGGFASNLSFWKRQK